MFMALPYINELIKVEQEPGEISQTGRVPVQVSQRVFLLLRRRRPGKRGPIGKVHGLRKIAMGFQFQPVGKLIAGSIDDGAIHHEQRLWGSNRLSPLRTGDAAIIHIEGFKKLRNDVALARVAADYISGPTVDLPAGWSVWACGTCCFSHSALQVE